MQALIHGTGLDGSYRVLEFSNPRSEDCGFACTVTVQTDDGFNAVDITGMIPTYTDDMLGFFEEIAAKARSWRGSIAWDSEFNEVSIKARNDGQGSVRLDVTLRWPPL